MDWSDQNERKLNSALLAEIQFLREGLRDVLEISRQLEVRELVRDTLQAADEIRAKLGAKESGHGSVSKTKG